MKAVDMLAAEHELIHQVLESLTQAREKIERTEELPREFFEKALKFCSNFADRFHHFKEEYVMFGLLAQKKGSQLDAEIGSLRYQHERGRKCISEIKNALQGYEKGNEIAITVLLENLAAYISILKRHIYKEDHIFFRMVERELSEEQDRMLLLQFGREEEKTGHEDFFEENRKLALEIKALIER